MIPDEKRITMDEYNEVYYDKDVNMYLLYAIRWNNIIYREECIIMSGIAMCNRHIHDRVINV